MVKFLDFSPEIRENSVELNKAFNKVLNSGWYILGKEVSEFEEQFVKELGASYCIGVGNGLEALQISLMTLGIGPGDEVITTPISAVATTIAIMAVDATPVFVDTKINGLIDETKILDVITKKTKAIMPVHLYGQAVNLKAIQKICRQNNLSLVEDACQAHGSTFQGKSLGTFGEMNAFSFYPTKNLGAIGDGGAIVTNNQKLAKIAREIRDYGQQEKYLHTRLGLNSRLDELQAALLKVKLKNLGRFNKKRQKLATRYIKNLSNVEGLNIITTDLENSNFHQFVITTSQRDKLQQYLKSEGIPTLIHYPISIPDQPFLKNSTNVIASPKGVAISIPIATQFVKETLSLPCHPYLTLEEVDLISSKIKYFLRLQLA